MTTAIGTILGCFSVRSVAIECPLAAALFGAAALWLIGHGPKAAAKRSRSFEILRVLYRSPGPFLAAPSAPGFKLLDLKGRAAADLAACLWTTVGDVTASSPERQSTIGLRVCTKQPSPNGLFNES
jgi:hypothetical protein